MNKSLALISVLLLAAGSLSAAEVFKNDVKLVAKVDEENRAGFYADASGEDARTDWSFTSDSAQSTAYFIVTSNTSHAMNLEAQLPVLDAENEEERRDQQAGQRRIEHDVQAVGLGPHDADGPAEVIFGQTAHIHSPQICGKMGIF